MSYQPSINDFSRSVPEKYLLNSDADKFTMLTSKLQEFHNELQHTIHNHNEKRLEWQMSNQSLIDTGLLNFDPLLESIKVDNLEVDSELVPDRIQNYSDNRRYEVIGVLNQNEILYGSSKYRYNYGLDLEDPQIHKAENELYYNIVQHSKRRVSMTSDSYSTVENRLETINKYRKAINESFDDYLDPTEPII